MSVTTPRTPWTNWTVTCSTVDHCASKWLVILVPPETGETAGEGEEVEAGATTVEAIAIDIARDLDPDPEIGEGDLGPDREIAEGGRHREIALGAPRIGPEAPRTGRRARRKGPKVRRKGPKARKKIPKAPSPRMDQKAQVVPDQKAPKREWITAPLNDQDLDPTPREVDDDDDLVTIFLQRESDVCRRFVAAR